MGTPMESASFGDFVHQVGEVMKKNTEQRRHKAFCNNRRSRLRRTIKTFSCKAER